MALKNIKIYSQVELDHPYDEQGIRNLLEPYASWVYGVRAAAQGIATLVPAFSRLPNCFEVDPSLASKIYSKKLTSHCQLDLDSITDHLLLYIRHIYSDDYHTRLTIGNLPGDRGRSYDIVVSLATYFFLLGEMSDFTIDYIVNEQSDYRSKRQLGTRSSSGVCLREIGRHTARDLQLVSA